ncbi:MAG TPA: methyltransferase domain-containing protein [Phototrophicaceae bacterium]|nr:methyltransferase domain-containing protein [Phototrophicaceae bacterium]
MQQSDNVMRASFTAQAAGYASSAVISDADRLARLVRLINPPPETRALEVATGPGYVAEALAAVCREVIGIDLTPAPLAIAERRRVERGLTNLHFELGNARALPFGDNAFDLVVCRYAFHHFPEPDLVLAEMARVCRINGIVAVEDMIASEHPERAAYLNRYEQLRDPAHAQALPFSRFAMLFAGAGLEVETIMTASLLQDAEEWLKRGFPASDADAAEARAMIERDAQDDLSGTRPFDDEGRLKFRQRTAIMIGRKLARE